MGAVPALPPYAHITAEATQCIAQASARYDVPELLLHAILNKENGRQGKCSKNRNGTFDCGLAQINTVWNSHFAKYGVTPDQIKNHVCTNVSAAAYILKDNFHKKKGDWFNAIVSYNIGPNNWTDTRYRIGHKYASDVVQYWRGFLHYKESETANKLSASALK